MSQAVTETRLNDLLRQETFAKTVAHMVRVVGATPTENEPFPHFVVRGIIPDDIYRELLALLPEQSQYEAFSYEKHSTGGASNRGRFELTDENLGRLVGRQRSFWLGLRDALGAPEFKAAVFSKLRAGLALRFGVPEQQASSVPGFPLPELFRETSGYTIKPHPDTRRKVVTMQIALPADESQEHVGTEFYRRSLNPLHLFREPRGFEVVKQASFLPNTAYAFTVINFLTLKSWHGRTMLRGDVGVRNTILNIWYAKAKDANADLVAQYYKAA